MPSESPEVVAARRFANEASAMLGQSPSFQRLDPATRTGIMRDLGKIRTALNPQAKAPSPPARDPYALALETPNDLFRRRLQGRQEGGASNGGPPQQEKGEEPGAPGTSRAPATQTLARRTGALIDEIDFPEFVASLIHGAFDAIVDSSIRQMEAFAELVSAVAKDVDRFTSENVTPNQVRDWLAGQYPRDLVVELPTRSGDGQPRLRRRTPNGDDEDGRSPTWLADFGLEGEELTDELIETRLLPTARRRMGENRMQMLATMVLMGMNRVVVRDGSITAKVRFRAAASDQSKVFFAQSHDPGGGTVASRGGSTYAPSAMKVSTVGVNVQSDTNLKAELFGEVRINFESETLPLDQFVDAAQLALLQQNARTVTPPAAPVPVAPAPVPPTPTPAAPAPPPAQPGPDGT